MKKYASNLLDVLILASGIVNRNVDSEVRELRRLYHNYRRYLAGCRLFQAMYSHRDCHCFYSTPIVPSRQEDISGLHPTKRLM